MGWLVSLMPSLYFFTTWTSCRHSQSDTAHYRSAAGRKIIRSTTPLLISERFCMCCNLYFNVGHSHQLRHTIINKHRGVWNFLQGYCELLRAYSKKHVTPFVVSKLYPVLSRGTVVRMHFYSALPSLFRFLKKPQQPTDGQHVWTNESAQSGGMALLTAQTRSTYVTWRRK